MDAYGSLFYGLGQVVYAISLADGKVQREEADKLHEIVVKKLQESSVTFDYADIIFKILKGDAILTTEQAFEDGMENIRLGDNHLTDDLKKTFVEIVEEIAGAYPPKTSAEAVLIDRFKRELK